MSKRTAAKRAEYHKTDFTANAASQLLSPAVFAGKIGFHQESVRRLLREGKLRSVKIGRHWRIPCGELARVLDEGIAA